ncbi:MAG: hypothetical protein ABSB29_08235 [Nitrososphaerales archaeon]
MSERSVMKDFSATIPNEATLRNHLGRLRIFFAFCKIPGSDLEEQMEAWVAQAKENPTKAEDTILDFIEAQTARMRTGEITSANTIHKYMQAIECLCSNRKARIRIDWKTINRYIPKDEGGERYQAYTREEILKIIKYEDPRIEPLVLLMASSGMDLSTVTRLTWGDIEAIKEKGQITCAKVHAFRGKNRSHFWTFITPEAYSIVEECIQNRKDDKEVITPSSPVLRNLYYGQKGAQRHKKRNRTVSEAYPWTPSQLHRDAVEAIIKRAVKAAGLREGLPKGKKRYDTQLTHGFRKFFTENASSAMERAGLSRAILYTDVLVAHGSGELKKGLVATYQYPSNEQLLEAYKTAVPALTITKEWRLRNNVEQTVQERLKEQLDDKEGEIENLAFKVDALSKRLDMMERIDRQNRKLITDVLESDEEPSIEQQEIEYQEAQRELQQEVEKEHPAPSLTAEEGRAMIKRSREKFKRKEVEDRIERIKNASRSNT